MNKRKRARNNEMVEGDVYHAGIVMEQEVTRKAKSGRIVKERIEVPLIPKQTQSEVPNAGQTSQNAAGAPQATDIDLETDPGGEVPVTGQRLNKVCIMLVIIIPCSRTP